MRSADRSSAQSSVGRPGPTAKPRRRAATPPISYGCKGEWRRPHAGRGLRKQRGPVRDTWRPLGRVRGRPQQRLSPARSRAPSRQQPGGASWRLLDPDRCLRDPPRPRTPAELRRHSAAPPRRRRRGERFPHPGPAHGDGRRSPVARADRVASHVRAGGARDDGNGRDPGDGPLPVLWRLGTRHTRAMPDVWRCRQHDPPVRRHQHQEGLRCLLGKGIDDAGALLDVRQTRTRRRVSRRQGAGPARY